MSEWQPIETALKNNTPYWAALRGDLVEHTGREDLGRWSGVQVPIRHPGIELSDGFDVGWVIAAPVGHGGFPDDWFSGVMPLPEPPETNND